MDSADVETAGDPGVDAEEGGTFESVQPAHAISVDERIIAVVRRECPERQRHRPDAITVLMADMTTLNLRFRKCGLQSRAHVAAVSI